MEIRPVCQILKSNAIAKLRIVTGNKLLAAVLLSALAQSQQIPRGWDDTDLEFPLARPQFSPRQITADAYYQLPVRPIWKSYPVYHPDKAPPGYIEWLRTQAPEQISNPNGEEIYDSPAILGSLGARPPSDPPFLHDKAWFDKVNPPLTREGAITGFVYVIRTKGKIEVGTRSCAMCHNRVMSNGAVIKGGQGNFPVDAAFAEDLLASSGVPSLRAENKALFQRLFHAPWLTGDQAAVFDDRFSLANAAKLFTGRPPGVMTPHRSTPWYPVQIPDIIGVQGEPARLMRYIARKQHVYNPLTRYSDEQLYALVTYLAALKPPASPYRADKFTRQGEKVLQREGCAQCHTPNGKLTPAQGFSVPPEHLLKYDIVPVVVGTDPGLAMETMRGTGYYKAPSLRGLWYRGALEHSGGITTLEEWLDPSRLQYSKGHEYGFKLNAADRFALIAFLRTL
ncbi:MAG: c-type cytochrome [Bryobacteraceae bacterium]